MKSLRSIDRPILFNFFKEWREWWEGFDEKDNSRYPTIEEKQKMLRYPIINSIVYLTYFPLLMPHYSVDGNELQVDYMNKWFERDYYTIMDTVLRKATPWGFCAAERIIESTNINGKPYWMHVNIIAPEVTNITFEFGEENPEITGFKFRDHRVDRYTEGGDWKMPGMVYYTFRGNEISMPYGDSILNDIFWAWQIAMKVWTTMVVYQRLHTPFLEYFYPLEERGDADNKAQNIARAQAQSDLKMLKNQQGATFALLQDDKGEFKKTGWLEVIAPPDREITFMESIRVLNTMMYVAALIPERLIEQFKDTGSQAMVATQKDFYTKYIIKPRIKALQNILQKWFIDPMLEVNFGKVDCTVHLTPDDAMMEFYYELIMTAMRGGQLIDEIDMKEVANRVGLPVDPTKKEPSIQTAERTQGRGTEFQTKRGMTKQKLKERVEKIVPHMNKEIERIKEDLYGVIKPRLYEQQGKLGLKIEKLYRKGRPKDKDLIKTIQIPNRVFSGVRDYLLKAWETGQRFYFKEKRMDPLEKPSVEVMERLRTLETLFEGKELMSGEGELLERSLYRQLANVRPDDALSTFNEAFENYVKVTLPTRVRDVIHKANGLGTQDFVKSIQLIDLKEKKEQNA